MEDSALAAVAFALGSAGNLFKGVPQFVVTAVRGRVSGLAAGAVWLALLAHVLWLCFGVAIDDVRFAALSVLGIVLSGGTLLRLVSATPWRAHRRWVLVFAAAAPVLVAVAAVGGDQVLAVAGVVMGVTISLPQLLHLWRLRGTDTAVSGVSQLEIVVVLVAQVGWTSYWLTQGQPVVAAGAFYGLVARAVTLTLLRAQLTRAPLASPM